jgi:hypothetical protein
LIFYGTKRKRKRNETSFAGNYKYNYLETVKCSALDVSFLVLPYRRDILSHPFSDSAKQYKKAFQKLVFKTQLLCFPATVSFFLWQQIRKDEKYTVCWSMTI